MTQPTRVLYPAPVERDEYGTWIHPQYSAAFGDDEWIPNDHPVWTGIEAISTLLDVELNYDDSQYKEFAAWDGDKPDGDGWFLIHIGDTEDGFGATWARPAGEQS